MPYLFNDDKSRLLYDKTKELIWQGDGTDVNGIYLNFEDLGINTNKYSLILFCGCNTSGSIDATCLFPAKEWFQGMLYRASTSFDTTGGIDQCSTDEYIRQFSYYPSDSSGIFSAHECVHRNHDWNSNGANYWNCSNNYNDIIPKELWGIL